MKRIFISYRQDDAKPWALLLRTELAEVFGEEQVFLDKDTLHAGNWRTQIQEALDRARVVLVVMGQRWLTVVDESGQRRIDRADDVHRQEIALALSRADITVIPVRVDGAAMPPVEALPEDIRALHDQQSHELSDGSARRGVDLKLLITDLERLTGLKARTKRTREPATAPSRSLGGKRWLGASAGILLAAFVVSVGALVIAEIVLGWTFGPPEISLIVLIVLGISIVGARLHARKREKHNDART